MAVQPWRYFFNDARPNQLHIGATLLDAHPSRDFPISSSRPLERKPQITHRPSITGRRRHASSNVPNTGQASGAARQGGAEQAPRLHSGHQPVQDEKGMAAQLQRPHPSAAAPVREKVQAPHRPREPVAGLGKGRQVCATPDNDGCRLVVGILQRIRVVGQIIQAV
jgi:hypothetical protein